MALHAKSMTLAQCVIVLMLPSLFGQVLSRPALPVVSAEWRVEWLPARKSLRQ